MLEALSRYLQSHPQPSPAMESIIRVRKRHVRQTVREVCRFCDCRPRDLRGLTVRQMLDDAEGDGATIYWAFFSSAQLATVL